MDQQTLDKLKEQLENDFENASFEVEDTNDVPKDPKDVPFGKALKLYASVLFLDLRRFTSWLDSGKTLKTAFKVLHPYLYLVAQVIKNHESRIEKFTGDGAMAIIGASESHTKACKNTLECAIDLAAALDHALNPLLEEEGLGSIEWGIGIEYGLIYFTRVGSRNSGGIKYNFLNSISKAANHASKLEDEAPAGQILVGENLYKQIGDTDELQEYFIPYIKVAEKDSYLFTKRWEPEEEEEEESTAISNPKQIERFLKAQTVPSVRSNGRILSNKSGNPVKKYHRYGG